MNKSKAKFVTAAGIFCCLSALILLIYNFTAPANYYFSPLLLFVGGIVMIILSLAYYTEK